MIGSELKIFGKSIQKHDVHARTSKETSYITLRTLCLDFSVLYQLRKAHHGLSKLCRSQSSIAPRQLKKDISVLTKLKSSATDRRQLIFSQYTYYPYQFLVTSCNGIEFATQFHSTDLNLPSVNIHKGMDKTIMRYFWVKIPRKSMLPQKLFLGNLSMHKFPRKVFGKLHLTIGFYSSYLELTTVSKVCYQIENIDSKRHHQINLRPFLWCRPKTLYFSQES